MSEHAAIDIPTAPPAVTLSPDKPPIAGGPTRSELILTGDSGLKLRTMADMFIFAKAVVNSGLAPKDFKTPEAVLLAIQWGSEIGMGPMQALQSIAVINGKAALYGDIGKALLRNAGFDIEEMDTADIQEKGFARCTITHPRMKPVTRSFSVEDAKKAGLWGKSGPWTQYPYRQMAWRAFWFCGRDGAGDILKGLHGIEEIRDRPLEREVVRSLDEIDAPKE